MVAKRLPIIDAVAKTATVTAEVGKDIWNGEGKKAVAALAAGGAEIAGNTIGFSLGNAAREAVSGIVVTATREKDAPDKSRQRQLEEDTYAIAHRRLGARSIAGKYYLSCKEVEFSLI